METIPVMDAGDGRRRADHSYRRAPVAKTASYSVLASDSGMTFTNRGAAGAVTFSLPAPTAGFQFKVMKVVAAQSVIITALAAGTILGLTAGITLTDAVSEGSSITLEADGTSWLVVASTGTWTIS